jgi:uncharacterized protein (DUF362 family)
MMAICSRRDFLGGLAAATLAGCKPRSSGEPPPDQNAPPTTQPAGGMEEEESARRERAIPPVEVAGDKALSGIRRLSRTGAELIVVQGATISRMVRDGLEAIGGAKSFLERGARVVLTPNFAWARLPELGITTHPEVVREMILICQEAGASDIVCLDYSTDPVPRAFRVNGAHRAVEKTRARLLSPWSAEQYVRVGDFQRGAVHARKLRWQAVSSVLLRCDVLISMPVFKHHREVGVTGAVKKLMGCVWRRAAYHQAGLAACIAELASVLRPTLSVVDGTRILRSNGPEGPGLTGRPGQILVSSDPVLADAYACRWLGQSAEKVEHLRLAAGLGVGSPALEPRRIALIQTG